jgi:anhydro-N-acetylmuramic acid kinase
MSELYIGQISGTSMDAIDAALVEIGDEGCRLSATRSVEIPGEVLAALQALVEHPDQTDLAGLGALDVALGKVFGAAANGLMEAAGVDRTAVRAIGSHGQTVFHGPNGENPFTMQIADPNVIAAVTGVPTVADFRRRDIALGGQGAPLVPAFHAAVFASGEEPRAVLNLGGIANLTLLVPGHPVVGFDTGPGNALMDAWVRRNLGCRFDQDGEWAGSADPDDDLLEVLIGHEYFSRSPPKSTGVEEFNLAWLQGELDRLRSTLPPTVIQATLCILTARTVAAALKQACPSPGGLYLCGGGAHNDTLIRRLSDELPEWRLSTTDSLGIGIDWVEAAAFAWLASRTLSGQPGNLPSVTGAREETILGAIYPA